ncbi:MAG: glycoside hydrolase family 9 protein [Bacteroidales bacterium]|nr:glycoside hydrolase family 9 protein [Bacteroidales bacterium]
MKSFAKHLNGPLMVITITFIIFGFFLLTGCSKTSVKKKLEINELGYFKAQGINFLVFNNPHSNYFGDSKISGIEIIHHGVRTATNGDVRLHNTPEQWNDIPETIDRIINPEKNTIEVRLAYPEYDFEYTIKTQADGMDMIISIHLEKSVPEKLISRAGFNLEFLPSAYFNRTYLMDNKGGIFPLYPTGPMSYDSEGKTEPEPIAIGKVLSLAPEDPKRHIIIQSDAQDLMLFDGRNKAQNGWYVVRSLLPADRTGKVLEWRIKTNVVDNWLRPPVIAHSQVGYHPGQKKIAVIELDKNYKSKSPARLLKLNEKGKAEEVIKTKNPELWGKFFRYMYALFDFSEITESGLYYIEYDGIQTKPFKIGEDIFQDAWHPTLDIFFPVQMDHMRVNEAYRVWHGASHLDDALQAPVNHTHFDVYAQGPTTDTPFEPGEHIPGLNYGGWFDAGDFDIRTQTHYILLLTLVQVQEQFAPDRDETTIDQERRYVDIHVPDGKPDLLQQIEHGTLALIAQYRAVGHAIPGIIAPTLEQYTHLGDASSKTDNLVYNPKLRDGQSDGFTSGRSDDRWAFTTRTSALNYGSVAALAAASRVLKGFNDPLADECLATAIKVWNEEQGKDPDVFRYGNTTGGNLLDEQLRASLELLQTTRKIKYAEHIEELLPHIRETFLFNAIFAARALPYMNESFRKEIENLTLAYKDSVDAFLVKNPYGVPIATGSWAGSGWAMYFSITNYYLYKAFPDIMDPEDVYKGLHYIYGCHPGSDISFVSGVGTYSKKVAYGNNRADFSFIAGGVVPGVLIVKPDFPENKEDWPFLWGENEYVINGGASYIFLVHAVNELVSGF